MPRDQAHYTHPQRYSPISPHSPFSPHIQVPPPPSHCKKHSWAEPQITRSIPRVPSQTLHQPSVLAQGLQGRPRSPSNRGPLPLTVKPKRKRSNTVSSVQPTLPSIPSASLPQMAGQWQGPVSVKQESYPFGLPQHDNKQALGLEPGWGAYLGLQPHYNPTSFASAQYNPSQYPDWPPLSLDITQPSFVNPQWQQPSAPSSNPPSGSVPDHASSQDGERITTPGMQYGIPAYPRYTGSYGAAGQPHPSFAAGPQIGWQNHQFYGDPEDPSQIQHTISPSQLGSRSSLKPTKSFSDLMREGRGSMSSASSTEGGHDWTGNALDDWTKPLQRALLPEHAMPPPSVPAPSKRPLQGTPGKRDQQPWHASSATALSTNLPEKANAINEAVRNYIRSPNRLAFGERKIIVMSPKVGQKSYGTEKRFLCPHPQAALIGEGWWTKAEDDCLAPPIQPPRVNIGLTGEQRVKDATVSWLTLSGRCLDEKINTQAIQEHDRPFLGNVAGKNLHISDGDAKRREVKAVVTVKAPLKQYTGPHEWGHMKGTMAGINADDIVGTFESKEIKVISKPSKKKASSKSGDSLIQHGSTVALFNRLKSQTTSTRYLSVIPDATRILGSDGKATTGAVPPIVTQRQVAPGFTASAHNWESFIIWMADPNKLPGATSYPPLHPDWPIPPANALPPSLIQPPIRFNSTVILQSLQTGICSPVLVIRRIEQDAEVVGGDEIFNEQTPGASEGELLGDPISQLQKVAFEIYRPELKDFTAVRGGVWLSCDQDAIGEKLVTSDKKWFPVPGHSSRGGSRPNSVPSTPQQRHGVLPMTPHTQYGALPSLPPSPMSSSSSLDYFGVHSRKASSTSLVSPGSGDLSLPSTDGGPIRRQRAGSSGRGPLQRPAMHKKRQSGDLPASSSYEYLQSAMYSFTNHDRLCWALDVGDVCVWSIVSTEQATYTFYVPDYVTDITEPLAPFPTATRLILPDMTADAGLDGPYPHPSTHHPSHSNPPLVTLYGNNFVKKPDQSAHHLVYYGEQPAAYNEVRSSEVMATSVPHKPLARREPIFLVREDGQCIIPTHLTYP